MSKLKRITSLLLTVIMLLGMCSFQLPSSASETCVITFNPNGGNGMPATVSVEAGTVINLPASDPKKPGMVFRGWAFSKEQADSGVITYAANTTPQILVNNSAELFASWAYEVTLTPGTQGWGSNQTLYKFPNVDLELYHHKNDIHTNYGMLPGASGDVSRLDVFVEWNTNQLPNGKGNGTAYHERYTTNAPATLYAVWGNPIVYNADGGTFPVSDSDIQEEFVVGYSNTVTDSTKFGYFNLPRLENAPIKAGCRLVTDANGEAVYARVFTDGTIYRLENHDSWLEIPIFNSSGYSWDAFYTTHTSYGECALELYAIWEPSVTYKANGGTGDDVIEYMTYAGTTLYNYNDYTVLENGFTSDSEFLGWNTMPDGSGTSYAAGDVISGYGSNEPLVLYAQWSTSHVVDGEYTVSFNAMEGYLDLTQQSYSIAYSEKYTDAIAEFPIPTRVGYIFKGWYNEETGSKLMYETEYYSLNKDTSFTAEWELHGHHVLECFKKEATCLDTGYYATYCVACGLTENTNYDIVPHTYGNWEAVLDESGNQTSVRRHCTKCLAIEGTESTATVNQEIVAYVNKDVIYTATDFAYVDTINYLCAFVDNGPGAYPFGGSYFANISHMWNAAKAYNPNVKLVYTVVNRNIVTFESWLQTESTRAAFANHLVGVVSAHGIDGIDIDFEFPQDLTLKDEFVALLAEIRTRLNILSMQTGKQYILSIATPAASWALTKYDLVGCSQYLDYFNIMNYDLYCGTAVPYTHHHTPPYDNIDPYGHVPTGGSVQSDIDLYTSLGISPNKIVSGMGLYSREWVGVANINHGLFQSGSLQESNLHYDLLVAAYINKNGYVRYWDDTSKAPYLYNASSGIFLSYEDPESIRYKCEIVARERVRGVMVFDYVTCDGAGIFGYIKSQIGSVIHSCTPGRAESKQVTCAENGYEKIYCATCDALMSHKEIYHEGHYCEEWEVQTPATATSKGILVGDCLFCGTQITRETSASGYTITLDGDGGSVKSSTKYIIQSDQSYLDVMGMLPNAEKEGYTLTGWYSPSNDYTLNMADNYAFDSDITFVAQWSAGEIDEDHIHNYASSVTKEATCTEEGIMRYVCSCGSSYTEAIPAKGHEYGEWEVYIKPSAAEGGENRRYCANCDAYESEETPATGFVSPAIITAEGTTVTVTNASNIDTLKYAKGSYTTIDEIEAAGATTIDAQTLTANAIDNVYTFEITEAGTYTFWEQLIDGRAFYFSVDITVDEEPEVLEPAATAQGAVITMTGLSTEVKDVFLALGEYDNYTDVNTNKIVRLTQNKLQSADSYSYTVPAGGTYTILVRYNDGSMKFVYVDVNVVEPAFAENGLQLTVSNLDGVKVIRTAYGEYKSGAEIKRAEGARAFTAKGVLKDVDEYTIQYRENGTVTVAVCYENGYTKIITADIQQKVPTMVQNDNIVTFGDLDDLKVIRYAKGEYSTSSEIKAAAGSVALKSDKIVNGFMTIELPSSGTYTFCVQYNDESYNYYVVTVE